jgi:hypothetical protein
MQLSPGGVVAAGVVVMASRLAIAGTPLPDPPFTSGGFVPPDSVAFKQEAAVGKLLIKYARLKAKCDQKAVLDLQLAYEPVMMPKVPAVQAAWTACQANAVAKFDAVRDKLILKGTPACLDQAGIDAIRAQIDFQFPLLAPLVYCDGDAAAPDPVTGLDVPDFKNEAVGEVAAAKVVTKAGIYASKCYGLALKYAFKLGGTLPPEILDKVETCFTKAGDKGNAAMAKLDQTQKLPSCLPLSDAEDLVEATIALGGQFNDETYCASPSGAFVDG